MSPAGPDPGTFPGGVGFSLLQVYDWPASDGRSGGSPHLHAASAEGYVVLEGSVAVRTISGDGTAEHDLAPGTVLWFTPGTVHRLVNSSGDLRLVVVLQNSGLPETGDAVLTLPTAVLADPEARRRRDLAMAGTPNSSTAGRTHWWSSTPPRPAPSLRARQAGPNSGGTVRSPGPSAPVST